MASERNALAALAERLNNGYVSLVVNDRRMATFTTAAFPELEKAQRIIAELANVTLNGVGWPVRLELADAYEKCRAIAEEGENNGD